MDHCQINRLNAKRHDPVERYREYVEFQLAVDGEGVGLREAREALSVEKPESSQLQALDELAVLSILDEAYLNPSLLEDDVAQPLVKWWWHLGVLRAGRYPTELLPEHLRTVYSEAIVRQAA